MKALLNSRNRALRLLLQCLVVAFFAAMLAGTALALDTGTGTSFTLQGCSSDKVPAGYLAPDPVTGLSPLEVNNFLCQGIYNGASFNGYTTGNLHGWNELDLVPHRVTAQAGNSAPDTQTYNIAIVADYMDVGKPGYDVISVPKLNTALSSGSCSAVISGEMETHNFGGIDTSHYRIMTITQSKNSTCVYDYVQRLAVGSHLFPGSSLHSNLANDQLTTSGVGSKEVSIPVKEIAPQEVSKTMGASQNATQVWNITKGPQNANVDFGNTCDPSAAFSKDITFKVDWQIVETVPDKITVITNIYAKNPASRSITVNVSDTIYSGTTALDTISSGPVAVPANTANALVLTHTITVASGTTDLNDKVTASYIDTVTQIPVPGTTSATASAVVQTGTLFNATATIVDTESMTGDGFTFSVLKTEGASGSYASDPSVAGTGPLKWTSDSQSAGSYVDFTKRVYLDQKRNSSGKIEDSAVLSGSDGFSASATAVAGIKASAFVSLNITKTIPDILSGEEKASFTFDVCQYDTLTESCVGGGYLSSFTVDLLAGEYSKTHTVSGLEPGIYKVWEEATPGYTPDNNTWIADVRLPVCSADHTFVNSIDLAKAQVKKVTDPAGFESGWEFTLSGPNGLSEKVTTTDAGYVNFTSQLNEGDYTITETGKSGWKNTDSSQCTFTVNYPADFGRTFQCTFENTYQPSIKLTKSGNDISKPTDKVTYNLKVENLDQNAANPSLSCTLTDAMLAINKSITLAPAASDTTTQDYTVPVSGAANDLLNNTANVSCKAVNASAGVAAVTDTSSHTVKLFHPSILVTKSTPTTLATDGDEITYTVTIKNTSTTLTDITIPNLVLDSVSDSLVNPITVPAECNSLATGASCSFDYKYTVPVTDAAKLENTVTAHYHPAGFPNDILGYNTVSVNLYKRATAKAVKVSDPAGFESGWEFTLTGPGISEKGTTDATGNITFASKLVAGGPYTITETNRTGWTESAVAGSECSFTISYPTNAGHVYTCTVKNTYQPTIEFNKTGDELSKVGDKVNYTITLKNTGVAGSPDLNCTVTDTMLGLNQTFTLPSGITNTISSAYTVKQGDADPLLNTAHASCTAGATVTADSTHSVNLFQPSVKVTKSSSVDVAKAGDVITYTVKIENTSSTDAPNLILDSISDSLVGAISGTGCESLASGASCTVTYNYTVKTGDADPLPNTVTVHYHPNGFPNDITGQSSKSVDLLHPGSTLNGACDGLVPQEGPMVASYTIKNTGDTDIIAINPSKTIVCGSTTLTAGIANPITIIPGGSRSCTLTIPGPFTGQSSIDCNLSLVITYKDAGTGDPIVSPPSSCPVAAKARVLKTTDGSVNPSLDWKFTLSGNGLNITNTTYGDADGILEFGNKDLDPEKMYTICEISLLPAGYYTEWSVNGTPVSPTLNCVTIGAGGLIPLTSGGTLTISVNNVSPGGAAKTIGYWKNWNKCSGGNQSRTALKNGGAANGFYLVEDLIPITLGNLLIDNCNKAVNILGKKDLSGSNMSADGAYELAAQLLAAKLNYGAGAITCGQVSDAITAADALLQNVYNTADPKVFTGYGSFLPSNTTYQDQRNLALQLANILDQYNNGLLCH